METKNQIKVGDTVDVDFRNSKYLRGVKVVGIRKTNVECDLEVPVGFDSETTIITVAIKFTKPSEPNQKSKGYEPTESERASERIGASGLSIADLIALYENYYSQSGMRFLSPIHAAYIEKEIETRLSKIDFTK